MKCDTGRPARGMTDAAGGAPAGCFGRKAAQAEEELQKLEAQDHGKVVLDAGRRWSTSPAPACG